MATAEQVATAAVAFVSAREAYEGTRLDVARGRSGADGLKELSDDVARTNAALVDVAHAYLARIGADGAATSDPTPAGQDESLDGGSLSGAPEPGPTKRGKKA